MRSAIDSRGRCSASTRNLASIAHLSHQTIWRGLRRLRGAHLVKLIERGTGGGKSVYKMLWKSPLASFKQVLVTPRPTTYPEKKLCSQKRTRVPVSIKAQNWAMARIREELTSYDITQQRRGFILSGLGSALWRGLKRGTIKAGRQLGQVVHDIIGRLRDAMAIGNSLHSWCSFGGWAVRVVVDDIRTKAARDQASAQLIAEIRREKEEAAASWQSTPFTHWRQLLPENTSNK